MEEMVVLFNSFEFGLFFPTVTLLYFLLPHRFRWGMLLAASCFFYMMFIPQYIAILGVTIVIDYVAALWMVRPGLPTGKRKAILIGSILSTCLVLFVFKYWNFFHSNLAMLARLIGWNYPIRMLNIILPIGLSFHTFQSLSYVIEVYRGHQKPERHFGIYALYVMFYPQLVAGPIERPQNLLHQFRTPHLFEYQRVTDGLKLMLWGMFKKVVIADRLAIAVNHIYGDPRAYSGGPLLVATVFFAFQIYCDFSGYSDIAIGAAQVMGFRLMDNFNRPYFSKSIAEFWKRWHISLSTWFRDYLYIPLGGNRAKTWRWRMNLFVTFLVSGLWHGANWTYVIWGALNGGYLIASHSTQRLRQAMCQRLGLARFPTLHKVFRVATTFSLVCVAWIFFRANTISEAWYIITHLFRGLAHRWKPAGGYWNTGTDQAEWIIVLLSIGLMEGVHVLQRHRHIRQMLRERPMWLRWLIYYALVLGILFFGVFDNQQFIYFQF